MRRRHLLTGVLIVAVLLTGGVQAPRGAAVGPETLSEDTVVARIGQTTYTLADIRLRLDRLEAPYRYAAERRFPEYVKEFVQREVLAREARRHGLDRRPGVQAEIEEALQVILIRALFKQVTAQAMPSPAKVRAYYREHEKEFRVPEQVEVDQVRVPTEAAADAIRTAIAAGQAFDAAVKAHTEAPINIATFPRGLRDPEVERVAFALKAGEMSQPIRIRDGVYLFRLRAHLPARLQSLEGATPVIQARLAAQNRERLWKQLKDRLWAAEGVEIREDLLKAAIPPTGSPAPAAQAPGREAVGSASPPDESSDAHVKGGNP